MRFDEFSGFGLIPQNENSHSNGNHDGNKYEVVEIISDHIERHIRSRSDHVQISSICQHKDGGLHISGTEMDIFQPVQVQVVGKKLCSIIGQPILVCRVYFIGEQCSVLWSSGAHQLSANHVQLVITSDYVKISSDNGLFAIADEHLLD